MRKNLIALAIAGSLATGVAAAQPMTSPASADGRWTTPVPVQYEERHDERAYWHRDTVGDPGIDDRQARLRERIERGARDGRLTREEAWHLQRQLGSIEARERDFLSDRRLSGWERRRLARDLDQLAANVRTQLRDEDRRY